MIPLYITITALMVTSAAQVPVLEPAVSQVCVSSGNREVSCTSKGHNLKFTWRLNNQSLRTTPADSESPPADPVNEQFTSFTTITVEADQSGNLTCEVKDEVGSSETSVHLTDCPGVGFQFSYATVIIAAASLLFLFALLVCFILLFKKPSSQDVNGVGEVTYADVKIQMGEKKRETKHSAETVEYGQVRVHHRPDE